MVKSMSREEWSGAKELEETSDDMRAKSRLLLSRQSTEDSVKWHVYSLLFSNIITQLDFTINTFFQESGPNKNIFQKTKGIYKFPFGSILQQRGATTKTRNGRKNYQVTLILCCISVHYLKRVRVGSHEVELISYVILD